MRAMPSLAFLGVAALIGCSTAQAAMQSAPATASASPTPAGVMAPGALPSPVNPAPAAAPALAESPAGRYEIEPTHTNVTWKLNYNNAVSYVARFDKVSGTVDFDPANPTASRADITIDPTSVNTGLPNFNDKIAKDVFKSEANPAIRFVSTALVAGADPTVGTMTGDLTLAGVTKPVTMQVRFNGARANPFAGGRRAMGFSGVATFKRSDFGSTQWAPAVGDEVRVEVEVYMIKQP
jgi:polyisoprenoid-binding protein YceI